MYMTETRKKEIVELGYKAFMAMFEESACPFKTETERLLWRTGFASARTLWNRPFEAKKFVKPRPKTNRYVRSGGRR